jgi:thymidylate synthase (FAD)
MEEIKRKVLDKGFVRLVDVLGNDLTIVKSARVSYGRDETTPDKDKRLIKFLLNNDHATPFEHVVFQFHIKCPIFVARQWMRHRFASYNEISGRYTKMEAEFYNPAYFRTQTGKNYEFTNLSEEQCNELHSKYKNFYDTTFNFYLKLLSNYNLAKEQARMVLPVGMYTQFYWTINARSLMNFLELRMDNHAQWEIRQYADVIFDMFKEKLPWTTEAFVAQNLNK